MAIKGQKLTIITILLNLCSESPLLALKKSSKGLKAGQGHQRPQSKKVKSLLLSTIFAIRGPNKIKDYFNYNLRKPSLSLKKVVKTKRLMKAIKGHKVK